MKGARVTGLAALLALCAACASGPRHTGTVVGGAIGAGVGALAGGRLGDGGTGALIGASLGALLGMLIGDDLERKRGDPAAGAPSAPPGPAAPAGGPPPAGGRPAGGDPTKGEFINATTWLLRVYVNPNPDDVEKTTPIVLRPVEKAPWGLDVGQNRIVARAYTGTQDGERLVGRFDRTIEIDVRRAGWFLEFDEEDFR